MNTSDLLYEGLRTQESLTTNAILAAKAPLQENKPKTSRSPRLPKLVALLAERHIKGPWHLKELNLNAMGTHIASGGFFDIFEDASGLVTHCVYRRVSALVIR